MEPKDVFRIAKLIFRKFLDDLSAQEQAELEAWEHNRPVYKDLFSKVFSKNFYTTRQGENDRYDSQEAFRHFQQRKYRHRRLKGYLKLTVGVAAMLAVSIGLTFFFKSVLSPSLSSPQLITAGESRAILTLADGRELQLMGNMTDTVMKCDGLPVNVTQGKVEYKAEGKKTFKTTLYNELTIPRKGEFMLTLADGTKVWLNSESWLKYPVRFGEGQREVWLEGEAYFEVTPDKKSPFVVRMGQASVKVLGTSFNIRAYRDEPDIYATLVEGRVKLSSGQQEVELAPEEQGIIRLSSGKIHKTTVDTYLYAAWKDGRFIFQEQRLEEIMNTLARWYDIEVFFSSQAVREVTFTGNLRRYDDFGQIVRMLEMTGMAHFQVKGNTVYISN